MRPGALVVRFTGLPYCTYVGGRGAWSLLSEATGRKPVWSSRERAFVTTERRARELLAVAQHRHYDLVVVGPRWTSRSDPDVHRNDHLDVHRNDHLDVHRDDDLEVPLW